MTSKETTEEMNARERLLTIAEDAFFRDGYDGVSVRDLTDAAGVNVALVNYYFGGKRNLYLEALQRKFRVAAELKCSELEQAVTTQAEPDLRKILTAYVSLHLGSDIRVEAAQQFLNLISRQLAEDDSAMEMLFQELVIPVHQCVKSLILECSPQLTTEEASLCIGSVTGQIFHFLRCPKAFQTLLDLDQNDNPRELVANHIIEFSLRGMNKETS